MTSHCDTNNFNATLDTPRDTPKDMHIDAVITWVNGSDEKHAAKLKQTLADLGKAIPVSLQGPRLIDVGEVKWCVDSILINAPWIRNIFIIADDQRPEFLDLPEYAQLTHKIKVVDHKEIFSGFEHALPSFNSRSIPMMLWKIHGISDRFIYFNDDFLIIKPVTAKDFFINDKIVINGKWENLYPTKTKLIIFLNKNLGIFKKKINNASHIKSVYLSSKPFGFKHRFVSLDHAPHPFLTSCYKFLFENHPEKMHHMINHKFRSNKQYSPEGLTVHYALEKNKAVFNSKKQSEMIKANHISFEAVQLKLNAIQQNPNSAYLCIQNLADADMKKQNYIRNWIENDLNIKYKK
ncbi:Stealth CR1 domain-containing protein [Marinicellulosiphila megalodicopiae]|uniref:Stealth CR1 domain-containing protein n=1 Tax=Marinicellulosiphila megalodicopiae TaxID=2724896 RepID=UPI003BAF0D76